jgi:hypothetical protein
MKKLFTILCTVMAVAGFKSAEAQSFSMERDTVYYTTSGASTQFINNTVVPGSLPVTLKWNIVSTNFPSDWLSASVICDNNSCYPTASAWASGSVKTSNSYNTSGANRGFDMQLNAANITTPGTYYMKVKLVNTTTLDSSYATFVVSSNAATSVGNINRGNEEISVYPNPATSEINFVYDGASDIRTAAIYSIIGKTMAVYRVSGNSANMNIENMPAGIYFIRLANAQGQLVATRKFTKQ